MFKPVTDLTERDKLWFFEMYKRDVTHYDLEEWPKMELEIQERIDEIFDDKAFSKLSARVAKAKNTASPRSELDFIGSDLYFAMHHLENAKVARDYFHWSEKQEKPSILEYVLWERSRTDGTVFVPASKPRPLKRKIRQQSNKLSTEKSEDSAEQSSSKDAEKKPKTSRNKVKKTARKTAGTATRRAGMRGIDKIRMIAAWAEGMMLPQLPTHTELPAREKGKKGKKEDKKLTPTEKLREALKKATVAIRENPIEFLKDKDFRELIDLAKNTHGAFRLTASFPASFLKNKGMLKLLPLPVTIGKVTNIAMTTGHDEDMVTFDWFSTDDPNPDRETMLLISDFLGALFEVINAF